jgi:thioredoxin reductase (NADPH)
MYDIIIVGGGVAAFTSALFSGRRGLKVLVVAKDIGGQANWTDLIENFPGHEGIGGHALVKSIKEQAERWGIETLHAEVDQVKAVESGFVIHAYGKQYKSKAVILAFGKTPRDLEVPGEQEFKGKGVSYCSNCDGPLFKKKTAVVAGYGDIGLDTALLLSRFAKKVYTLSKTDKLAGHPGLVKAVGKKKNVELVPNVSVQFLKGDGTLKEVHLLDNQTNQKSILKTDGLFVELGYVVHSEFLKGVVNLDEQGQVITDKNQATSVPGIFAAGDATDSTYKQAVITAGEAATAALAAYDWIMEGMGGKGLTSDWTQIKRIK